MYNFDPALCQRINGLNTMQLDVFLNEFAPDSRRDDDAGWNAKGMTLSKKIMGTVAVENSRRWWRDAVPADLRDESVRMATGDAAGLTGDGVGQQKKWLDPEEMELLSGKFEAIINMWGSHETLGLEGIGMRDLDDVISYTYYKHKQDGVFNAEGWHTQYPDRFMWEAQDGMVHCTKLNKLLFMKLFKMDPNLYMWLKGNLGGIATRNVDAMIGNHLQGMIRVIRKGGLNEEERQRIETRKRNVEEIIFQPCRDHPNCRRAKRCKYLHAGRS